MSDFLLPIGVGIAFGVALERAGLGNAKKLTGQFYLTDFTVFKVMFTAIVTAMVGLFWCSRAGWVDLSALAMPETYLRPQIVGGLVFGAGFALAGLCPGTSCVAAASGRGDGIAVVGGMFTGVLVSGLAFPLLLGFYDSDARGAWTLPALLHLSYGSVVLLIAIVAILGFVGAEMLERRGPVNIAQTFSSSPARLRVAAAALVLIVATLAAISQTPVNPATAAAAEARAKALFKPASGC